VPSTTPRLNSLTSLRYFAALAVVVTHVNPHYVTSVVLRDGAYYGFVGVSFFYLLSGFVLTWSCSRQAPGKFWWNRFSRVWPMMATMMVLAYVFFWPLERHPGPSGYALQAVLLQSWDPNPNVYAGGDGPVWSLSCEMFFYLMFPLIILAVRRMRALGLVLTAAAVIGAMIAAPILAGPHVSPATYLWLFFYLPGYRIGEFIIGMLLARAVALGLRFRFPSVGYLLGCACLVVWTVGITRYTLTHHGPVPRPFVALLAMPCFVLLLLAGASADLSGRARAMGAWLPVRLGEWSFALYLVHPLLAAVVGTHHWLVASTAWGGFGYLLVFLAAATVVAAAAHYTIEKPVERWLRRRYPGRRDEPRHRKDAAIQPAVTTAKATSA
jgi:peptidoglycan/LPS O-acetylase OafA/YrhL